MILDHEIEKNSEVKLKATEGQHRTAIPDFWPDPKNLPRPIVLSPAPPETKDFNDEGVLMHQLKLLVWYKFSK